MEDGLIVPAIPRADEIGLGEIARIRADLVERARQGKLTMEEIERGTFTVSSLAQFDITFFTAILNPPQSGILTLGKMEERPVARTGRWSSERSCVRDCPWTIESWMELWQPNSFRA